MKIALLPARKGSKRIRNKNIKDFCGKPIIAWSIQSALKANIFDKIIVSTDSKDIANIAKKFGADSYFLRPKNLSDDNTGIQDVMNHAVKWMSDSEWQVSYVCCVYPASPLINPYDIIKGYELIKTEQWSYCLTASQFPSSVYRSFKENNSGGIKMLFPENFKKRSQDLPSLYFDAAQFIWGTLDAWKGKDFLFGKKTSIIKLPFWRVQDIDTIDDWQRAESIFKKIRELNNG